MIEGYGVTEATAPLTGNLPTGDLGSLDEAGRRTLHGRLEDILVTSGGKTVSPDELGPTGRARSVGRGAPPGAAAHPLVLKCHGAPLAAPHHGTERISCGRRPSPSLPSSP